MPHFCKLSNEVITIICTFLPSGSLAKLAQTCLPANYNAIRVLYLRDARGREGDHENDQAPCRALPYGVRLACAEPTWGKQAIEVVKRSFLYGGNVNQQGLDRQTALTVATTYQNVAWIRALLKKGADPNVACYAHQYHYATMHRQHYNDVKSISRALDVPIQILDDCLWTPLCIPVIRLARKAVDLLIDAGASGEVMISRPHHHWHVTATVHHVCAIKARLSEMGQYLIQRFPGSIDSKTNELGFTPLWLAVQYQNDVMFYALLQAGAGPNVPCSTSQKHPLHNAISRLQNTGSQTDRAKLFGMIKALVAAGADVNAADAGGRSPLMDAVDGANIDFYTSHREVKEIIDFLIQHGADVNRMANDGRTVLTYLAQTIASNGKTACAPLERLFDELVKDNHAELNPNFARRSVLGGLLSRWGNRGATDTNVKFISKAVKLGARLTDEEATTVFDSWVWGPVLRRMYDLPQHKNHIPSWKIQAAYFMAYETADVQAFEALLRFQPPSDPERLIAAMIAPKSRWEDGMIQYLIDHNDIDFDWQDGLGRSFLHHIVERFASDLDPGYKHSRAIEDAQWFIAAGTSLEIRDNDGKNAIQRLRKSGQNFQLVELHLLRERDKQLGQYD